jgi:hypothetical protein
MLLNHFVLALMLFISISVNVISSTHFYPILFIGVIYYLFSNLLHKKEYYKLFWLLPAFLIFEVNFGLPIFSMIILSYIVFSFIIPAFSSNLSFSKSNYFIGLFIFYIIFFFFVILLNGYTDIFLKNLLVNYIVDIIFITVFL